MPRSSGAKLKSATRVICEQAFLQLQLDRGVTSPKPFSAFHLDGFRHRLADIDAEVAAVKLWKKLRPQLAKTRAALVAPIEELSRQRRALTAQLQALPREDCCRVAKPLCSHNLERQHVQAALKPVEKSLRHPPGGRCATFLRRLTNQVLPHWDWQEPEDRKRHALIQDFRTYNYLNVERADFTARELAVIALLLGAWWPVPASFEGTPSDVINKETDRMSEAVAELDGRRKSRKRIVSPLGRKKRRVI